LQINNYNADSHILVLFNLPVKYYSYLSSLDAATVTTRLLRCIQLWRKLIMQHEWRHYVVKLQ